MRSSDREGQVTLIRRYSNAQGFLRQEQALQAAHIVLAPDKASPGIVRIPDFS